MTTASWIMVIGFFLAGSELWLWWKDRATKSSIEERRIRIVRVLSFIAAVLVLGIGFKASIDDSRHQEEFAKQQSHIKELQNEIADKQARIEVLANETMGLVSGGKSFIWMRAIPDNDPNKLYVLVEHTGDYPVFDVRIQLMDDGSGKQIEKWTAGQALLSGDPKLNKYGAITSSSYERLKARLLPSSNDATYVFLIRARNGTSIQELKLERSEMTWKQATRITSIPNGDIILEQCDKDFTKEKLVWADFHL
jgi:hypothetical protein